MCVSKNDVVAQREWPLISACQTKKHSCEPVTGMLSRNTHYDR